MNNFTQENITDILNLNNFNREQRLAIFLDRHTFISANAGSGKTSVLISKYLYELFSNDIIEKNPEHIVAITFTNKAASEMTKRVYEQINNIIKDNKLKQWGLKTKDVQTVINKFTKSRISTIHSFCIKLIKDYPIESKLVPGFREGSENDLEIIINDFCNAYLKEIINGRKDNNKKEYEFLKKYDLNYTSEFLKEMYRKRFYFRNNLDIETIYDNIKDNYLTNLFEKIKIIIEIFEYGKIINNDKIEESINVKDTKKSESYRSTYNLFINNYLELKDYFDKNDLKDIDLLNIIELLIRFTNSGKLGRSNIINLFSKNNEYNISEIAKYINNIIEEIEALSNSEYKDVFVNDTEIFVSMVKEFISRVDSYKEHENIIDFDDILHIVDELLDNENILNEVRKGIKLLMVDEFQDTSHVQFSIVNKIVGNGDLNDIKLVIVGDEKQSIYGFRDAEIEVFKKSKELIAELNSNLHISLNKNKKIQEHFVHGDIKANGDENKGIVELKTSYRMQPYLASFLNLVNRKYFDKINDKNVNKYFVNEVLDKNATIYTDFVYGVKNKYEGDFKDDLKIEIDVLQYDSRNSSEIVNDGESENEDIDISALNVLNRIINLLNSGVKEDEIAVICRKAEPLLKVKDLLDKYNIDSVVHTKYNLFSKREIKDIFLFLKFIIDPYNDLNFAGLLRSYFFNYNDSEILNFTDYNENDAPSLYEKFILSISNQNDKNKKTMKYLNTVLDNSTSYDIFGTLNLIFENSFWYQSINAKKIQDEIENTLKSFIENLSVFLENNSNDLYSITEYINKQILESKKDHQDDVKIQKNKINMMTIHGSKGLEFKNVLFINLHSKNNTNNNRFNFSKKYNLPILKNIEEEFKNIDFLNKINKIQQDIIDKCEDIRLFYVALSRAEEGLYLIGERNFAFNGFANTTLKFLIDFYEDLAFEETENGKTIIDNITIQNKDNQSSEKISYNFKLNKYSIEDVDNLSYSNQKIITDSNTIDLNDKIEIEITKEDFTATKFKNYNVYKSEYFKRYILGVPEFKISSEVDFTDFEDNPIVNATERGIIVHNILEKIKDWYDGFEIDYEMINSLLIENSIEEDEKDYYIDIINKLTESKFFKENSKFRNNFISELSLKLPLEKSFLSCKIDLCFKSSNDSIEIWDWKTDKVKNKKEIENKANIYEYQLKSYVYASYYFFNKPIEIKARLLFLDYLKENDNTEDWIVTKEFSFENINQIKSELINTLIKVNRLNFGIA